uniref:Conserved domain protein n=1 Tax=Heterorhabditis bacteriophora TaxID=37862 RepID=A0A1I7WLJ0_HETBA
MLCPACMFLYATFPSDTYKKRSERRGEERRMDRGLTEESRNYIAAIAPFNH